MKYHIVRIQKRKYVERANIDTSNIKHDIAFLAFLFVFDCLILILDEFYTIHKYIHSLNINVIVYAHKWPPRWSYLSYYQRLGITAFNNGVCKTYPLLKS